MFSQYVLHRRPDHYPNPERFNPDRFTVENEKKRPRYAYLPFGGGHRICLGKHIAMLEGHLILATLVQKVGLELVTKQKKVVPKLAITLRPAGEIKVRVRRR